MAVTQFTNLQVKDGTLVIADFSATGTPSSSTYLRGDNTWSTVSGALPDLPYALRQPASNQTLPNFASLILNNYLSIISTFIVELDGDATLIITN